MRSFLMAGAFVVAGIALAAVPACGSDDNNNNNGGTDAGTGADGEPCVGFGCTNNPDGGGKPGCVNLECKQVECQGGAKTTVTGVVLDPAGKVPVFNATVYVPNKTPDPLATGAVTCDRCDAKVSGSPVAITATDTSGAFTLENVPVGDKIPLVIQIGKWRRQVELPAVAPCVDTPADAGLTRLPRNRNEGDIPRIALATGAADPLQCLLKKIGIDESEFGTAGSDARIHLYAGAGFDDNGTPKLASSAFAAGGAFANAETLWNTVDELKKYDVVMLACEGNENDTAQHKSPAAKQAVYDYAKAGGRLFTTHFHHTFFSGSPDAAPKGVAVWTDKAPPANGNPATTPIGADIVGTFPKALAMKEWLTKQQALTNGKLSMIDARHNADAVNAGGLNWITATSENAVGGTAGQAAVQYLTFNAPIGAADDQVCGRAVFTNLHVGAGTEGNKTDDPTAAFPTSCQTENLSAQQKALEFMLFDLSSCVQKDDAVVVQPR
ncbi:MAG: carboxypeptidase regulatory-like domain-containing protein [Myxococcales bacterium]|nr:carboxypeptidase regulatory-like domain-containing protein [Myxococcales bacterium]